MVVVDTNIIIDHLRTQQNHSQLMRIAKKYPKETLAISMISVQELYEGRSTRDSQKEQFLLATISPLKILPYTYEVAQLAGEIALELDRPIELADAAIAATVLVHNSTLLTLNKKNFKDIRDLRLESNIS